MAGKTGDPDTMYLDHALKQPNKAHFIEAMKKEVSSQEEQDHWEFISCQKVPEGMKVLPSVWSMKQKQRVAMGEVYKHKACLNMYGGKQEHRLNFWETYSLVVNWFTIWFYLITAIMYGWHTRQIDFVLAFPQAEIECNMYMAISAGFAMPNSLNTRDYCLKLMRNLYRQKQARTVWNQHLHKGLISIRFEQHKVGECLYYRSKTIFLMYVNNGILIGPDHKDISLVFTQLEMVDMPKKQVMFGNS